MSQVVRKDPNHDLKQGDKFWLDGKEYEFHHYGWTGTIVYQDDYGNYSQVPTFLIILKEENND